MLLLLLLLLLRFLFLFFPVPLHRSLPLFLVIQSSFQASESQGDWERIASSKHNMSDGWDVNQSFLGSFFFLILFIWAAENSPTHASENEESNGLNQNPHRQWYNHVTMSRCHARFRYRGGNEPNYPVNKPAGGAKSY